MSYSPFAEYEDEEDELDEEPLTMESVTIYPAEPCSICGVPGQSFGCHRCGKPVCMDQTNYMHDAPNGCGSWIMDWHSNSAMSPDDGNEYYCKSCLEEVYGASDATVPQVQTK